MKEWDMTTGKCIADYRGHTRGIRCLEFDGKKLITGGEDKKIIQWDRQTQQPMFTLDCQSNVVSMASCEYALVNFECVLF